MSAEFKREGEVVQHVAATDITVGDTVVMGNIVGVAIVDIATGDTGSVRIAGVFEFPKTSANVMTQGLKVYWNSTLSEVTTTATANTLMGIVDTPAGAGVVLVEVLINVVN